MAQSLIPLHGGHESKLNAELQTKQTLQNAASALPQNKHALL
jgi:hypothetical protein